MKSNEELDASAEQEMERIVWPDVSQLPPLDSYRVFEHQCYPDFREAPQISAD